MASANGGYSQESPEPAQSKARITGTVVDQAGEPVIGANIVEKDVASNGTITGSDGNFSLNVSPGATLVVSYIGYVTQEIAVGNRTQLQIVLQEDLQTLEEVVVIGYGTVRKSDLTGSVASVSDKQFKDQPVKRVEDILQGRTPGVEVTTLSGIPGGDVKVRIRGTTSINKSSDPLYIVDGIVSTSGLEGLNPSDIQSIEVLKDASATAIYGSRGANGVVLVTTRKGQEGKAQITVDAAVGVSNIIKKYDLLSAYEYALALNDIWGSTTVSAADVEAYRNGTKGIDWQDIMTQTGISQDYKLSISGGNAKNRYLVSGNMLDISAITITTKFQRAQLRVNLDTEVAPWLTLSTKLNASRMHGHNTGVDLMNVINYSPAMEMKNEETGVYNRDPYNAVDNNPYGGRIVNYNDNYRYYLNGNLNLLFRIVDGLTLSVQGGANYYHNPNYSFTSALAAPGQINGMSNGSGMNIYWQNTNNLTYQKTFGDHSLTATAVWEASNSNWTNLSISGSNLSNEVVGYWNISNAATRSEGNDYSAESIVSGIGRLMYSYKGRYMLTGTFRADGSSKFQGDNKWGYFPSGALAWDVAKEDFMSDLNLFQQLKARASFGITGNQDIGRYSTLGMLSTTSYGWGTSSPYTGYWGNSFATPNVRWEKTYQYDLGVDLSMLDSRLNFTFDWFLKDSKDLLFQKTVPSYNGGGSFWVNQGEVKNSGVEFSVNTTPVNRNDLRWETTLNASYVKNEIVDLAGSDFILQTVYSNYGGAMEIMKPGYPLGSFYLYQWKGFDDAGANLYQQANGSLTTSPMADDQVVMGQSDPKWTFGWNNMVSWKNWSASVFINAATGHNRLNMTRYALASMTGMYRFITLRDAYYKGWDKVENKADAIFPSNTNSDTKYYGNSDFWLENASFLKLKNISIAYRIPKQIVKVADIQLSVSAQNLFILTKYKGMDPEVYSSGAGVDYGAYPVPRTVTFGAKLDF
ncbi:MAG: TonB-dependent receptor [Tannerella sp.]|nr:TonB-dependent receptor [Tannerella sp.]